LIDDLLTLARTGDRTTTVEAVSLADAVENCWRTVETGDATLDVAATRTIRADRSRLEQLLQNLVQNAVEHGGSDVTITVGDVDDGFYVADDGAGLPADADERVFEPGYSTADDATGFGLGIVAQVATDHGWTVDVAESEAGGARFEIRDVEAA
jgi:signal transduction histidine kinase